MSETVSQSSMAPSNIPNTITKVCIWEAASITRLLEPLDEKSWSIWHEHIHQVFKVCGVLLYVDGTIQCLDKTTHPEDFEAWEFNNSYAQCLISNNIIASQMMNVSRLNTAHEMWTSLEAVLLKLIHELNP